MPPLNIKSLTSNDVGHSRHPSSLAKSGMYSLRVYVLLSSDILVIRKIYFKEDIHKRALLEEVEVGRWKAFRRMTCGGMRREGGSEDVILVAIETSLGARVQPSDSRQVRASSGAHGGHLKPIKSILLLILFQKYME